VQGEFWPLPITGNNGASEAHVQQFLFLPPLAKIGRRRKTLLERVLENSFRPGRYGQLLAEEPLPEKAPFRDRRRRLLWQRLLEQQRNYREAKSGEYFDADWYRERAAEGFGRYVCALHGSTLPSYLPLEPKQERPKETLPPGSLPRYVLPVELICEECGRVVEDEAFGWVALLAQDGLDELPELGLYCLDCAQREFGLVSGRGSRLDRPTDRNRRPPAARAAWASSAGAGLCGPRAARSTRAGRS
jgi:hypothetical protein